MLNNRSGWLVMVLCFNFGVPVFAADLYFALDGVNVRDLTISADGSERYMTIESLDKKSSQIIRMDAVEGEWSAPKIAAFSGQFKDLEPFLHPNGLQLFFVSNRNEAQTDVKKDFDIWQVTRAGEGDAWSEPQRLPAVVNTTDGNEFYPSVSRNGNLYFTATKPGGPGKEDIYVSRLVDGVYQSPEPLPVTVNSETYEFNAYISPDENLLLFSSFGRKDGLGGGDLYQSRRENGEWQMAVNLGPEVNSPQLDYCPFYDPNKQQLYWTSNHSKISELPIRKRPFAEWMSIYRHGFNGLSRIHHSHVKMD